MATQDHALHPSPGPVPSRAGVAAFGLGLAGLIPYVGIVPAVAALVYARRARREREAGGIVLGGPRIVRTAFRLGLGSLAIHVVLVAIVAVGLAFGR